MSNKLTEMVRDILAIEADLPYRFDYSDNSNPTLDDFEIHTFEQTWGSTALGFGGVGGQMMTSATTYVFIPMGVNQKCFVYFAGRFAYAVDYSDKFMNFEGRIALVPGLRFGILALLGIYYVYPLCLKLANVKNKKVNFLYYVIFVLFIIDAVSRIWLGNNYHV